MTNRSKTLAVNLFAWRVNKQKRKMHKGHVNKSITERPRLRTV